MPRCGERGGRSCCSRALFLRAASQLVPIHPNPSNDRPGRSGRLVAVGLRVELKQPIISKTKPGANGALGVRELLKAEPDGWLQRVDRDLPPPPRPSFGSYRVLNAAVTHFRTALFACDDNSCD